MLTAVFVDKYGLSITLQNDLKTERGYLNRAKKYKSNRPVHAVEFYRHSSGRRPYYNPNIKPHRIVHLKSE